MPKTDQQLLENILKNLELTQIILPEIKKISMEAKEGVIRLEERTNVFKEEIGDIKKRIDQFSSESHVCYRNSTIKRLEDETHNIKEKFETEMVEDVRAREKISTMNKELGSLKESKKKRAYISASVIFSILTLIASAIWFSSDLNSQVHHNRNIIQKIEEKISIISTKIDSFPITFVDDIGKTKIKEYKLEKVN
jgi:hypothetical protein